MSEEAQQHGPGELVEFQVGSRFKLERTTYEVTKVGPKMIEARSKAGRRWFWRRTLHRAGAKVVA